MKRHHVGVFYLLIVFVVPCFAQSQTQERKASFLELCYDLWKRTDFGWHEKQTERAAWIIRDPDGRYRWMEWDYSEEYRASTWKGKIPNRVIAQIHTHPQLADPEPSKQDCYIARKIKVPVYTVSALGIWSVSASGKITKEAEEKWYRRIEEKRQN
jgi:hypothetical protein